MDSRPNWIEEIDQPAMTVLAANDLSRMARRANQITEEMAKIRQRVDKMIQTFERTQGIVSHGQNPDMEILEDVEDLENVLHDITQKKRYQQKLTVFIVGYEETCGQRRHLLTQLQEFFSIYSNLSEEGDQKQVESIMDLDGIANQVTQAVSSAEAAMSRLTDIHAGIISCVNQTMSAGAQGSLQMTGMLSGYRREEQCRGRKKIEKALEQAKQDIGHLTDQLLQAQEDLTFKDQQMKELVIQNERRFLEMQHIKSQLEVTKKSLQTLQDETAMQQSLLEAELRRQEKQLKELEDQEPSNMKHVTDASTQWEISDYMEGKDEDEDIPIIFEEEKDIKDFMETVEQTINTWEISDYMEGKDEDEDIPIIFEEEKDIKDFMETVEQTINTEVINEDTEWPASEMELLVLDPDKSTTENEEPVACSQVCDENPSDPTLLALAVEEDNSIIVSVNMKDGGEVSTSYPSSETGRYSDTPPPIPDRNISPEEPGNLSKLNDGMGGNISTTESKRAGDESQSINETSSVSFESREDLSNEDEPDHHNTPQITQMDASGVSQTVEEQITDIMPSLSVLGNEPHVGNSKQEPDVSDHHLLSEAPEAQHIDERQLCSPTGSNNSQINAHPMPTNETDCITINRPTKDPNLMKESTETVDNRLINVILSSKPEEDVQLIPSASSTEESLSTSIDLNNNVSISSSSQESPMKISIPEHNKTAELRSSPLQSNLGESPSLQIDSLLTYSLNTKTEDIVHTESISTSAQTTINDPIDDRVDPGGAATLCEDVEEIEMKKVSHIEEGNNPNEKSPKSDNSAAQMWMLSQRLHTCVQEIKDLLIKKGLFSLADGLTAGMVDCNGDEISRNIIHLNHLPEVLNRLLQSASESDEHKHTADEPKNITNRNMETQTDRHLLGRVTEVGGQHSTGCLSRDPSMSNSANIHMSIFTRLDEEHNRRVLQRASDQGKIPNHVYQDASRVMSEYRSLCQESLCSLASGYVQYISWNKAENHLQRQCLTKPHMKPALSKMKVLKHKAFLLWKEKREQSQREKLNLSISLNQLLQGVQEDSGIFLIKPVLSWPGRSLAQENHSQILSHYRAPQRTKLPPLDQNGILCSGKVPPCVPKEWKTMGNDAEIQPAVVTPKILEMDVHRYMGKEYSVSQIRSSAAGLLLRTPTSQKLVSIKQTSSFPAM